MTDRSSRNGAMCARCGEELDTNEEPHWIQSSANYDYCNKCCRVFEQTRDEGVVVRNRYGNRDYQGAPYEGPGIGGQAPNNQTEALAGGLRKMREKNIPGLFIYQKTGSYWLIDEYLEAHPSIANDVESLLERVDSNGGSTQNKEQSSSTLLDFLPF
jgi:hypothetical protein